MSFIQRQDQQKPGVSGAVTTTRVIERKMIGTGMHQKPVIEVRKVRGYIVVLVFLIMDGTLISNLCHYSLNLSSNIC